MQDRIVQSLEKIEAWCKLNDLNISYEKTKYMIFHKEKDLTIRKEEITPLKVNNHVIQRVFTFKYLGVWLDPSLNFIENYNSVSKNISNKLKFLHGVKRYIPHNIMPTMINAYVHSIIDYAIEIWCVQTDAMVNQLQKPIDSFLISYFFPNIYKKNKKNKTKITNINPQQLRDNCKFLTVKERLIYVILKITCKSLNLNPNFLINSSQPTTLSLPRAKVHTHKSQIFKKSFNYRSSTVWNKLPRDWDVKFMSYDLFKEKCFNWIVSKQNDDYIYF